MESMALCHMGPDVLYFDDLRSTAIVKICHVFDNLSFYFFLETTSFLSSKLSTIDIAHTLAE
jgi:hypothetical protein